MTDESASEHSDVWARALANFGGAVVAYVLDIPSGQRPSDGDYRRWHVVRSLATAIDDVHLKPEQRVSFRCQFLSHVIGGTDKTYLEICRMEVGGRMPIRSGDELVDAFVRLVFNGLAMEYVSGSEWDRFSISTSFQDPTLYNPVAVAFLRDPDLTRLFPGSSEVPDRNGMVSATSLLTWLPNGGGSVFLQVVVGSFVEQTLARMRFKDSLREENIELFVRESLDQLRCFARGEEVSALVLTGLIGIEVAESIDRGWWGITRSEGLAINQLPFTNDFKLRSVLWITTPHRLISITQPGDSDDAFKAAFSDFFERSLKPRADLRRRTMSLQFGLLAWAVESAKQPSINVLATTPWSLFPIAQTEPPFIQSPTGHVQNTYISAAELASVAHIVEEVGDVTPRLDIALSRMIRVASERRDSVDALIDGVVAWENMLGSKSETTFKVCAAIAWLLEPDNQEERGAIFSKAKKIYSLRSDLVHGSVDVDPNLAPEYAQEALIMAVHAFRRVHSDTSLKDLRSSSRCELLLMRSRA